MSEIEVEYISRSEWSPRYGEGPISTAPRPLVVAHHTERPALPANAGLEKEIHAWKSIERHHGMIRKWLGIGYNWGIYQSGRIIEGRGWHRVGAHAGSPANGLSYGIAFVVDGREDELTPAAVDSFRALIRWGIAIRAILPEYRIDGHGDWMQTECPGPLVRKRLSELRHDYLDTWPEPSAIPDPRLSLVLPPRPVHPVPYTEPLRPKGGHDD